MTIPEHLVVALLATALCGCTATSRSSQTAQEVSAVEQIHHNMSIGELQSAIAGNGQSIPLRHFWTTAHDGREIMLTAAHVDRVSPFCFLFVDQQLGAILVPGFGRSRPIEDSLKEAMAADALTIEEFRARCREQRVQYERAQELKEFNIALAPMLLFDRTNANARRYVELMGQFDATRVGIGMTQAQTDTLFGKPIKLSRTATQVLATYGREIDLESFAVPMVTVAFRDDIAVSVQTRYHAPGMTSGGSNSE